MKNESNVDFNVRSSSNLTFESEIEDTFEINAEEIIVGGVEERPDSPDEEQVWFLKDRNSFVKYSLEKEEWITVSGSGKEKPQEQKNVNDLEVNNELIFPEKNRNEVAESDLGIVYLKDKETVIYRSNS